MTLPRENVNTKQNKSLVECSVGSDLYARRVTPCPNAVWNTSSSGLSIAGRISEVTVSSSAWTPLPATALDDRNALCLQNQSAISIKINYDNTESGWVGVLVPPNGQRYYDVTDSITIYAKAESGSPVIIVEEIS